MLWANSGGVMRRAVGVNAEAGGGVEGSAWLDLVDPTEEERAAVERATGLRVPGRAELSAIENSSRLGQEHGVLYLSMSSSAPGPDGMSAVSPLGLVVSERRLLTVRFGAAPALDAFAAHFAAGDACGDGRVAFLGLLEAIVARLADVLEQLRGEMDAVSRMVFQAEGVAKQMRGTLRGVGRTGDRLGAIRDSLLGVERIAQYAAQALGPALPETERGRLATIRQDVASLSDYDKQLSDKVQFLLDAVLGLINIEQNNKINVLTVVSVVGVPPTLVASIYGMNFHNMPELDWAYGYQYGLTVLVLSALLPLVWFKVKGWI